MVDDPHFSVAYAVAFPNVAVRSRVLPTSLRREQFLTKAELDDPTEAIEALFRTKHQAGPGAVATAAIMQLLAPDIDLTPDPEARGRYARKQLARISANHVRALESLDINRRVFVTGKAGTGKSRLAVAWAMRAAFRGDRVLLTCFNDPLSEVLRGRMPVADHVVVGPFLPTALALEGMPPLDTEVSDLRHFWNVTVPAHLQLHWPKVTARFDTIVVDESQDFSPAWLALLTSLLDPAGPRRLLMCGDTSQAVYQRGFIPPTSDDGWVLCELARNCRNAGAVARLIQRQFDGAPPAIGGPEANEPRWVEADDDTLVDAVAGEYDRLVDGEGYAAQRVLFATLSSDVRDRLREAMAFVEFERSSDAAVMCENVHRVKGLEFDYVVLVVGPHDVAKDDLLYVGCSRAVSGLTVVGPRAVAERLGLA